VDLTVSAAGRAATPREPRRRPGPGGGRAVPPGRRHPPGGPARKPGDPNPEQ